MFSWDKIRGPQRVQSLQVLQALLLDVVIPQSILSNENFCGWVPEYYVMSVKCEARNGLVLRLSAENLGYFHFLR